MMTSPSMQQAAPNPKRSREDNLKIIAACNRLIEQLRLNRDQLPDGI